MRTWIILILCWYFQDLAQLVMTQTFLAPEIFIMAVIWHATGADQNSPLKCLCAAIAGGLLMDFRWTGVPGLNGALYALAVLAARMLWFRIPEDSRHMLPYVFINAILCAVLTFARLLFWNVDVLAGRLFVVLGAQWLLTALFLILFGLSKAPSYEDRQI